ncbi:MAG: hypothetical protein JWQ66_1631 [Mucilaginibacter sp.]|nr:hypothetical protein [Mucilaginibacter sp.]
MKQKTAYGTFPVLPAPDVKVNDQITPPALPSTWQATALLHPYSPPPDNSQQTTPFFQVCLASVAFIDGQILSVQVTGLEYGTWWYKVTGTGTVLSTDEGNTWNPILIGWSLPTTNWLGDQPTYFSTSYLNWMEAQEVDWWKQPVPGSNATTWIWFDSATALPFRMMFGAPPPTPTTGDPNQLAFFQNFSFTYFTDFEYVANPNVSNWQPALIPGFYPGNQFNYKMLVWNSCFAMTTLMTPVDSASMPLPTLVLYQWKPDNEYQLASDRTQCTMMSYEYNPSAGFTTQVAMLYGEAPPGAPDPPVLADQGFIFDEIIFLTRGYPTPVVTSCQNIGLGQEPPDWAGIPAVQGTIHATVVNNAALCPGQTVNIISVLFPPTNEYPQGRYLWTWYSPFPGSDGSHCRPVTFMESASDIAEGGTSLALADYYQYMEMPADDWFPAEYFDLPAICPVNSGVYKNS